jgi:hypothetical protein
MRMIDIRIALTLMSIVVKMYRLPYFAKRLIEKQIQNACKNVGVHEVLKDKF